MKQQLLKKSESKKLRLQKRDSNLVTSTAMDCSTVSNSLDQTVVLERIAVFFQINEEITVSYKDTVISYKDKLRHL